MSSTADENNNKRHSKDNDIEPKDVKSIKHNQVTKRANQEGEEEKEESDSSSTVPAEE